MISRAVRSRQRWLVLAVAFGALCLHLTGLLQPVQTWLADERFRAWSRSATGNILLVDIDAKSLSEVGVWPWPRAVHAAITSRLAEADARTIGFDVDFSAASDPGNDAAFAEALERAGGGVLLAAFNQALTQEPGETGTASNRALPSLAAHSWPAHVNVIGDEEGRIRSINLSQTIGGQPTPAMAALLAGFDGDLSGTVTIDYSIDPASLDRVSAVDLIEGKIPAARIAGRSVLVGAAALELRDVFQVPMHGLLSGPVIQALAAETLSQGRPIRAVGGISTLLGLVVITLICMAVWLRGEWRRMLAGLVFAGLAIEACAAGLQVFYAISLDTSLWQVALAGFAIAVVMREIDVRRILLAGSRHQTRNTRAILDRVVADNFAGILVVDEDGTVRAMSRRAAEILECDDLTGKTIGESGAPGICKAVADGFAAARRGEEQQEPARELRHVATSGVRRLEYTLTVSRLAEEAGPDSEAGRESLVACLSFRDVTEERTAQERLAYMASYDVLTGLPNRNAFCEGLADALDRARTDVAVLFFDLDRFKTINDTLGHTLGDALLRAVGERLRTLVGGRGTASRFGGDEFAIFVPGMSDEDAAALGRELIDVLGRPYVLDKHRLAIGVSVGCARSGRGETAGDLIKNSDTALYRAKAAGGNNLVMFDPSMDAGLRARQAMEMDLWKAFDDWEFELVYQPQMELATREMVGVEVLLRWRHPVQGYISPVDFIPVAEAIGLIDKLGRRILVDACAEVASWPGDIKVSVNVSPSQFIRGDLVRDVEHALEVSGLPPHRLDLEITESLFIHDQSSISETMRTLRARGVSFSIDDFGTGYSSLSYIRQFPVDKIKIDRSFVSGLPAEQDSIAIVSAVVAMANGMQLRVNAEGVETELQSDALRMLGCHEGQGWLFGRPVPASQIVALLTKAAAAVA